MRGSYPSLRRSDEVPYSHDFELCLAILAKRPLSPDIQRDLRRALVGRLIRNAGIVGMLVAIALAIGATGYHLLAGLSWLDATLNATMILTGMGPADLISAPEGKVFAIAYALFSGVFFLTMFAVLLAPALQHFLHRFHLDLNEQEGGKPGRSEKTD